MEGAHSILIIKLMRYYVDASCRIRIVNRKGVNLDLKKRSEKEGPPVVSRATM